MTYSELQLQTSQSTDRFSPAVIADAAAAATKLLVGPIVCREGGFAFDTFSCSAGTVQGFPYRRAEHADYDRKSTLAGMHVPAGFAVVSCDTTHDFAALRDQLQLIGGEPAMSRRETAVPSLSN